MDTQPTIRESVELLKLIVRSGSRQDVVRELAAMLTRCLSAHGAVVWSCVGDDEGGSLMVVETWNGRVEASDWLANSVSASEKPLWSSGDEVLQLGVPIKRGDKLVGVLEVHQRPTTRNGAVMGYVCFMEQMAEIVGSSEVF